MFCKRLNHELNLHLNESTLGYCAKMKMPITNFRLHDEVKKEIINGSFPTECQMCKTAEEKGIKSWRQQGNDLWSNKNKTFKFEITLDNTCNQACCYCYSILSSVWLQEKKAAGKYGNLLDAFAPTPINLPEKIGKEIILNKIKELAESKDYNNIIILLLGGEPLLSSFFKKKQLEESIDYFYKYADSSKKLCFEIITNSNVPEKHLIKYIDRMEKLKIKYPSLLLDVTISMESTGTLAEYVRYGVNWKRFQKNVDIWLASLVDVIKFQMSVNTLSVTQSKDFLMFVENICNKNNRKPLVIVSSIYEPSEFHISVLDRSFTKYLEDADNYIKQSNIIVKSSLSFVDLISFLGKNIEKKYKLKNTIEYYKEKRNLDLEKIEPIIYNYVYDR